MKIKQTTLAFLTLITCAPAALQAASVGFTDTLPTENVLVEFSQSQDRQLQWRNDTSDGNRWVGFSFSSPSDTVLSAITMYIKDDTVGAGALGADMTISIVSMQNNDLADGPALPYNPLYSEQATFGNVYSNEDFFTFTFDTPYALSTGVNYGIVFSFDSADSDRFINIVQGAAGTGGTGNIGYNFASTDEGSSFSVNLQGNPAPPMNYVIQTIPEPTSASIFGLLIISVMLIYRRSKRHR